MHAYCVDHLFMSKIVPYPLCFEPILKEKVWGGRRLNELGKRLPAQGFFGESWEIADLASTSPSGGGGEAARSIIANGPLAGRTLNEAIGQWGEQLLGSVSLTPAGDFPLLVKYLDAREHLSVQVHPSPAYARTHPQAHLKTECWFVLEALPGSVIYKGVKAGVSRSDIEAALRSPQGHAVVELLDTVPAVAGDCHNLPSGTVHALGAGVLVAEVQTASDTTFRVYDWAREYGRVGRALHIEEALACMDFSTATPGVSLDPTKHTQPLINTEYYTIDAILGEQSYLLETSSCQIIMCTQGSASFETDTHEVEHLQRGQVCLVPAATAGVLHISQDGVCLCTVLP